MNTNIATNFLKLKEESTYILKIHNKLIGLKLKDEEFNFKTNKGSINFIVMSLDNELLFDIDLGTSWIFIFSELIDLYNRLNEETFFSHQWKVGKNSESYRIKLTHNSSMGTLLTFTNNDDESIAISIDRVAYFELLNKIIEIVQKIKNFRFSFINLEDEKRKLAVAKINDKQGTIITTYNGIEFGKPYLSESDKYQIKYSAIHRILFGRWLSVHAERINISPNSVITTVDEEYILDTTTKNKSSLAALILLASLCFKGN